MILNYKFGLFPPENWDEVCEREITLQHDLWNKLVGIELTHRAAVETIIRANADYREAAEAIASCSAALDTAVGERAEQRRQARAKIATADLDAQIAELSDRRRGLWATAKPLRAAAFREHRERLRGLEDVRYHAMSEARRNSGLWWGNYNAVMASFDATLRRLGPGQQPRPIEGPRTHDRLTIQIQQGCPAPAFENNGRREACLDLDPGQWQRRGANNWHWRSAVLTATVHAEGRGTRKTASWRMTMHRPFPEGAVIKSLTITRKRVTPTAPRWTWQAVFAVDIPDPSPRAPGRACGIDLGWRKLEGGDLRVATIASDDGGFDHLIMPARMLERRLRIHQLLGDLKIARRNEETLDIRRANEADYRRLNAELARWSRRRLDLYRVAAARIVETHDLIGIDQTMIGQLARDRKMPPETRRMRTWAAPSEFAQAVIDAARRRGVTVREITGASTITCHKCGHRNVVSEADREMLIWRCQGCRALWDQDENAARNCLAAALDATARETLAGDIRRTERRRPSRLTRKSERSKNSAQSAETT